MIYIFSCEINNIIEYTEDFAFKVHHYTQIIVMSSGIKHQQQTDSILITGGEPQNHHI